MDASQEYEEISDPDLSPRTPPPSPRPEANPEAMPDPDATFDYNADPPPSPRPLTPPPYRDGPFPVAPADPVHPRQPPEFDLDSLSLGVTVPESTESPNAAQTTRT